MKKLLGVLFLVFTSLFSFSVLSFETGNGKILISKTIGMARELPGFLQPMLSCGGHDGGNYLYQKHVGLFLDGNVAIAKAGKAKMKKYLDVRVRKIHLTAYWNFRTYMRMS